MPGVSSSGATAPLPPPCLACEALVSAVLAFLSSRRRTELEVFSAMDGVCDARSMGADMSAACHALLGTHGEALEAAIIGSRAGVLDGSDARQVCAKAGVDDCGPVGEGRGGVRKQRMTEEAAAAVEGRGTINPQVVAKTTVELPSERAARFDPLSEAASRSDGRGRAKRGGAAGRGQGGAAAAATKAALQRPSAEACGILAHEIAMRRAVEVAKSARRICTVRRKEGVAAAVRPSVVSATTAAETASAAALSRALEEAMDDTCEANAAFHASTRPATRGSLLSSSSSSRTMRRRSKERAAAARGGGAFCVGRAARRTIGARVAESRCADAARCAMSTPMSCKAPSAPGRLPRMRKGPPPAIPQRTRTDGRPLLGRFKARQ